METNQVAELQSLCDLVYEEIIRVKRYLEPLIELGEVARDYPDEVHKYGELALLLRDALLDSTITSIARLIDSRRQARTLLKLFNRIERWYDLAEREAILSWLRTDREAVLEHPIALKIKRWRHEIVSHSTESREDAAFYSANRMKYTDMLRFVEWVERDILEKYTARLFDTPTYYSGAGAISYRGVHDLRMMFEALSK